MQDYFECIVVPVDFGQKTSIVIKQAYILAQLMNVDIVLLYVKEKGKAISSPSKDLNDLAAKAAEKYNINIYPVILEGDVTKEIVNFSRLNYSRMIIMGNAGANDNNNQVGENTSQIIREAECPVLTINSDIFYDLDKILLPLDLTKPVESKLSWAIYFSRFFGCIIKIVSILPHYAQSSKQQYIESMFKIKSNLNDCNVFCTTDIIYDSPQSDSPGKIIVDYAKQHDCDLIMVMTQQEELKRELKVGRTASKIIGLSDKPVISITPKIKTELSKSC